MRTAFLALGLSLSPVLCAQYMAEHVNSSGPDDGLFRSGERACRAGDHAGAVAAFDRVIAAAPEHINAYLQRGFCLAVLQEHQKAVDDLSKVIARKPDHLWAYTCRSASYMKLGLYDLAIADLDRVLQLDPSNEDAFNNRGWAYKAKGEHDAACQDWNASRKLGNAEAKIILNNNRCK